MKRLLKWLINPVWLRVRQRKDGWDIEEVKDEPPPHFKGSWCYDEHNSIRPRGGEKHTICQKSKGMRGSKGEKGLSISTEKNKHLDMLDELDFLDFLSTRRVVKERIRLW